MNNQIQLNASLFSAKNIEKNLFRLKHNLKEQKKFLKLYKMYPTANIVNTCNESDTVKESELFLGTEMTSKPKTQRKKFLLKTNKDYIENIFRETYRKSRNNADLFFTYELKETKYSNKSVDLITSMSKKTLFMKKTLNYMFPRIYDLRQKERDKKYIEKIKVHKTQKSKSIDLYRKRNHLDFSSCVKIKPID